MNKLPRTIFLTGLLAGTLDICSACVSAYLTYGSSPVRILHFVAAGAFGMKASLSGGWVTALCGLVFHYIIAYCWTILFFMIYPHIPVLSKNRVVSAIVYGAFVWLVMNLLVLPLTKLPPAHFTFRSVAVGSGILMFAIGMPLSFGAYRYYARK